MTKSKAVMNIQDVTNEGYLCPSWQIISFVVVFVPHLISCVSQTSHSHSLHVVFLFDQGRS